MWEDAAFVQEFRDILNIFPRRAAEDGREECCCLIIGQFYMSGILFEPQVVTFYTSNHSCIFNEIKKSGKSGKIFICKQRCERKLQM